MRTLESLVAVALVVGPLVAWASDPFDATNPMPIMIPIVGSFLAMMFVVKADRNAV